MTSKTKPTRILLHSDVAEWLASKKNQGGHHASKLIFDCIADWKKSSIMDEEEAWARLVYSAHAAPHGHGSSHSIRIPQDLKDICVTAAKSVREAGWQAILNAMVRVQGAWRDTPATKTLEFHPDGLERIKCIAGAREFHISSNTTSKVGTLESWLRAGAEVDPEGRVVIRAAEFEEDGIWLISGTTRNMRTPEWWPEICDQLMRFFWLDVPKEVVIAAWWSLFSSKHWNEIELKACENWAQKRIESGHLRIDQAPKQLDNRRAYIIWRAQRLNNEHGLSSGRSLKPHNMRRRETAQIAQNLNLIDPGANAISDIKRAITLLDGHKPSEQEADNALKRAYEDGYAQIGPKRG